MSIEGNSPEASKSKELKVKERSLKSILMRADMNIHILLEIVKLDHPDIDFDRIDGIVLKVSELSQKEQLTDKDLIAAYKEVEAIIHKVYGANDELVFGASDHAPDEFEQKKIDETGMISDWRSLAGDDIDFLHYLRQLRLDDLKEEYIARGKADQTFKTYMRAKFEQVQAQKEKDIMDKFGGQ